MKRTNIVIDESLVEEGMSLTGIKTCKDLVDRALHDLVRRAKQRKLLELRGKISWEGDLSEMRKSRTT